LEVAVAVIVASILIWLAITVAFVVASVWIADLCEAAYNFFWKVHDDED